MSRVCLYSDYVSFFQFKIVGVVIVSLSGVLELHLNEVGSVGISRHVGKPVVGVELFVLSADGFSAQSAVAIAAYLKIVVVNHCLYVYCRYV